MSFDVAGLYQISLDGDMKSYKLLVEPMVDFLIVSCRDLIVLIGMNAARERRFTLTDDESASITSIYN